ncbi:MAG: PTS sugar transporter subunit IIA [Simkaniaceae bacterium]|nr:PTS sugar transporter subunit IIA [Simkaniaceae bacterium]MCF7852491.1 PTS sugar transporter subunit IIA [Simkaniaceae bacterium]
MDLKIKDVAELLHVSETTIRRWLGEGKIPAYKLHHQYRFSRTEIENWMLSHRLRPSHTPQEKEIYSNEQSIDPALSSKKGWQQFSLFRAIHKGGVIHKHVSSDKATLIRDVMQEISLLLGVDAEGVGEMLLDRESLMPTALGHGIAIPHTRDFLIKSSFDLVCPVFLETPIDWGALDGEKVHTCFFLFASDDKHHLNLLAKIAYLTSDPKMRALFQSRPEKNILLDTIKQWESKDYPRSN